MTEFFLIKTYNLAYIPWLRAHLKKKRIMGDREYTLKEAQNILIDMDARGAQDEFFKHYYWYWRDHPEYQPAYLALLEEVIPGLYKDDKFDLGALNSLDAEAKKGGGRILFTVEDVSIEFFKFYHDVLLVPLSKNLESNVEGATLSNYFEFDELSRVPDLRQFGREKVNQGQRDVAAELLHSLEKIALERIRDDIVTALNHYDEAITRISEGGVYRGRFDYVELSANPPYQGVAQYVLLTPSRSYGAIKEGYEGALYPTFVVGRLTS
jgi:hypothetical protein